MKKIVFYSWQSDLPNSTNRSLIEEALKQAALEIQRDDSIDIEPVIDRDTQGMAGAPDIASTIFAKITAAYLFIADISIISKPKGKRATPNPNVLIELGYAMKATGHERIVLVFNKAFGKVEEVPFDLKMRRMVTYNCSEGGDYAAAKKELMNDFKSALVSGLANSSIKEEPIEILNAIENQFPNKIVLLRRYLSSLLIELEKIQPKMFRDGGTIEELIEAISKTQPLLVEFAKLAETNVLMNDMEATEEIFKWFGRVYEKYDPEANQNGKLSKADGDFFRFIGHEMFVMFISPFLKEEKWKELKTILTWTFKADDKKYKTGVKRLPWFELYDFTPLFDTESKKRNRLNFRSDLLKDRHATGGLSTVSPLREFSEADLFLYFHGEGETASERDYHSMWYPVSLIWLDHIPTFIADAEDYPTAMKITNALLIGGTDEFKRRIKASTNIRSASFPALSTVDLNKIGSKGGAQIITPAN